MRQNLRGVKHPGEIPEEGLTRDKKTENIEGNKDT